MAEKHWGKSSSATHQHDVKGGGCVSQVLLSFVALVIESLNLQEDDRRTRGGTNLPRCELELRKVIIVMINFDSGLWTLQRKVMSSSLLPAFFPVPFLLPAPSSLGNIFHIFCLCFLSYLPSFQ
ncbi:hypothetical protein PMG11_04748 [Penicillium brasilianum]|uniref:Uncharacterized protein n=1 Tax=Penicillium brasilianum TaxID=104259 RepID=A0A0F7VJL5_PENBI|nr:hypothetical protein PMG11_04748 [Penicillium brasilianum]